MTICSFFYKKKNKRLTSWKKYCVKAFFILRSADSQTKIFSLDIVGILYMAKYIFRTGTVTTSALEVHTFQLAHHLQGKWSCLCQKSVFTFSIFPYLQGLYERERAKGGATPERRWHTQCFLCQQLGPWRAGRSCNLALGKGGSNPPG